MLLGRALVLAPSRKLAAGAMGAVGGALLARGALAETSHVREVKIVRTRADAPRKVAVAGAATPRTPQPDQATREDEVDAASEASFPASDAPSWTSSGVGAPAHPREPPEAGR